MLEAKRKKRVFELLPTKLKSILGDRDAKCRDHGIFIRFPVMCERECKIAMMLRVVTKCVYIDVVPLVGEVCVKTVFYTIKSFSTRTLSCVLFCALTLCDML